MDGNSTPQVLVSCTKYVRMYIFVSSLRLGIQQIQTKYFYINKCSFAKYTYFCTYIVCFPDLPERNFSMLK